MHLVPNMYSVKYFLNISRPVFRHTKLNKNISNYYRSNCTFKQCNWPTLLRKSEFDNGRYQSNNKQYNKFLLGGILFSIFEIFYDKKEEDNPTSELITTIKRSILLIKKNKYIEAEQMLHVALRQAQTLQNYDGITYVYDVMANLAFDREEYSKAEKLFVSVMQRIMEKGAKQDDMRLIHMSLKLAKLFEKQGDIQKAEQGYQYCFQHLNSKIVSLPDDDVIALLGMTSEWYAGFLLSQSKYQEALKYYNEAYNLCIQLNGEQDIQTIYLLNNLGTVCYLLKDYPLAQQYFIKAAKLGHTMKDIEEEGLIHVNLGYVNMKLGLFEDAFKECKYGLRLSELTHEDDVTQKAKDCLEDLKKLTDNLNTS
ncbi:tetratricopeptide repeat protein 19 homolog, mitochondrial [Prorops nasuta]|uniref:tetratricopeptide repeat protein 19 homolog, mitochondrial n=1 Tax=Prorops nasuta TaxID=863751 RepID=UPI0034CF40D3